MAACIDEYGNRFKAGPICKVLSEAPDCGSPTPRGYRMSRPRPVSRMRARHEAPDRPHVAGITFGRMADGRSAYTASVTDMFARRIVGRACATTMNTEEPPLQALEQAIAWAASRGRDRRPRPPRRSWRAVHRHGVRRQGDGIRHAAVDRHGRRLPRQRHGRIRRRRVQDRSRLAAQALP